MSAEDRTTTGAGEREAGLRHWLLDAALALLVLKGRVDHKQEGETKLIAIEVAPFEATPERSEVRLRVDARRAPAGLIRELADLTRRYPGEAGVVVAIETSAGRHTYAFGPTFRVRPEPDFYAEVKALLGEAAIA